MSSAPNDTALFNPVTEFPYPCESTTICFPYSFSLLPGAYLVELYGASGGSAHAVTSAQKITSDETIAESVIKKWGGNALASALPYSGGAGAYTRGILVLRKETHAFLHVGGRGSFKPVNGRTDGGYNGGGRGMSFGGEYGGGGGGSTDLRFEEDDCWHRVMVAAGGGGADNAGGVIGGYDDGSGGCGGELQGQGMWVNGVYNEDHVATQTSGFSFFQGEASQVNGSKNPENKYIPFGSNDRPGAGGGWYGGFARHHGNAGSGGGSSFVLHQNAIIPKGNISLYDEEFKKIDSKPYAFAATSSEYNFVDWKMIGGIRSGNGLARIVYIGEAYHKHPSKSKNKVKLSKIINFALLLL